MTTLDGRSTAAKPTVSLDHAHIAALDSVKIPGFMAEMLESGAREIQARIDHTVDRMIVVTRSPLEIEPDVLRAQTPVIAKELFRLITHAIATRPVSDQRRIAVEAVCHEAILLPAAEELRMRLGTDDETLYTLARAAGNGFTAWEFVQSEVPVAFGESVRVVTADRRTATLTIREASVAEVHRLIDAHSNN